MQVDKTRLLCALAVCATGCGAAPTRPPTQTTVHAAAPEAPRSPLNIERRGPTGAAAEPTPLLNALATELTRSMETMGKSTPLPPYYVAYSVADRRETDLVASFGVLDHANDGRARTLDIDLRVGDKKLDNTHGVNFMGGFEGRGVSLPLDDDAWAIREQVWLATDRQYRGATEALSGVKTQKSIESEEEDPSDDFSTETPSTYLRAPATLELDRAAWEKKVIRYSALFRQEPQIHSSSVTLQAIALTHYLVTSEGTRIQMPWVHTRLLIHASTKADDGMDLERVETFDAGSAGELPDDAAVEAKVKLVIDDLVALRKAPAGEPFVGPAILDGRAAAVLFHEVLGHRSEGHRQKQRHEGQTFTKKIGEEIMSAPIDVYDDPSIASINGTPLNGHYFFDDEGVAPQRALIVEGGKFHGFLMSRQPVANFPSSNGHGRRQEGHPIVARQGNLVVAPRAMVSTSDLKAKLVAAIKAQGKPYGLRVREVSGGLTGTARFMPQAFRVDPVMVYRVYPDGREELTRGLNVEGTPLTALSKIDAAADDFAVFNGFCGAESGFIPVAAVSPSLFTTQLEMSKRPKSNLRPPLLPPPPVGGGAK